MSYELGFSPEFFLAVGEPYDRSDLALNDKGKPVSVYSAICMMQENNPEEWNNLARDVFDCEGKYLTAETVLEKVQETNSCSNLCVPVIVWVDAEADYVVKVWDDSANQL